MKTGPRMQIQDQSPESRPVASRNQSQMQLMRSVATSLGFAFATRPNMLILQHLFAMMVLETAD